jgi:2,5-diamino-6-(ribosylamino)-4(3H)-pyrimidinone 5'-phosphate reductase
VTLDGKIATAERRKFDLSSREDRRRMAALRDSAGALIVGAGTLRAEDPPPFVRGQKRPGKGRRGPFAWVILTRSLEVPAASRVLRSDEIEKIIVAPEGAGTEAQERALRAVAEVWRIGRGGVDLAALLGRLRERGIRRVVVEGGGEVNFSFLEAGLVDEVFVTLCPYLLGGAGAPTLADGAGFSNASAPRLVLLGLERAAGEVFLHYRCERRA